MPLATIAGAKQFFVQRNLQRKLPTKNYLQVPCGVEFVYYLSNVASHSPSLIHNVDSNAVERYNSIVAKFVGGKRINFSRKGTD